MTRAERIEFILCNNKIDKQRVKHLIKTRCDGCGRGDKHKLARQTFKELNQIQGK